MPATFFQVEFSNLHWIVENSEDDLCAHGSVAISIDSQIVVQSDNLCVTTGALYLLRSLFKDVSLGGYGSEEQEHMIPCCGHGWIARSDSVMITGSCDKGIRWNARHQDELVILSSFPYTTPQHTELPIQIAWRDYAMAILPAIDSVLDFHKSQPPRLFFDDEARQGYHAFWGEFDRLLVRARDRISR